MIGIVGRLQPWKGQHRFWKALAELRSRGYDVHGLMVGGDAFRLSPGYPVELSGLVERLDLGGTVTMTGQVDDPAPLLELMDVAVNASEVEPFGIALLEAMASRVPVVAVGRGGPLDILDRGRCGMLALTGVPPPWPTPASCSSPMRRFGSAWPMPAGSAITSVSPRGRWPTG